MLLSSRTNDNNQSPQPTQFSRARKSSSPSFWIAQAVGALLVCPPDLIERWLPMAAPFPATIEEIERRSTINQILEDCWDNSGGNNDEHSVNSGYEIEPMDAWIVDNQAGNRKQHGHEDGGDTTGPEKQPSLQSGLLSVDTTSVSATKKTDSVFSNYFLSLHLLFSLPSFGDERSGDIGFADFDAAPTETNVMSPLTMKPSTYGEITPLGARQLFGAMELLHNHPHQHHDHRCARYRFVDLGSGTGKLVGQAVLELPSTTLKKATGIELSPSRHESAIKAKTALEKWIVRQQTLQNAKDAMHCYDANEVGQKLELIEGDLFGVDLSTATHIYVASLCFPDNLMLRLEETLCQLITRQQHQQHYQDECSTGNDENAKDDEKSTDVAKKGSASKLEWVATLRQFPNDLGGIQPSIRFMEMSWTSPLGCAVYLYRCDGIEG